LTLFKKITAVFSLIIFILFSVIPVAAAESYPRADAPGGTTEFRLSREAYTATREMTAATLGLSKKLEGITDMAANQAGDIFLLCGEKSRLVRISSGFTEGKEIVVTDTQGNEMDYSGAKGIYCDADNRIYIADTANARLLVLGEDGVLEHSMEIPVSDLIPENFLFQPVSVAKDEHGYIYVLSLGCYYGALFYTPHYEFMGFYGSNTVNSSALDTLSSLWNKLTGNETKKSSSVKKLPYSFTDFSFDPEGYMVTCTGSTTNSIYEAAGTGQIKKISPNGANILYKRSLKGISELSSSINFLEDRRAEGTGIQELVSIAVSSDNYIFALDRGNGTVYMYDYECNLMSAFGGGFGNGGQLGTFKKPAALTFSGDLLLVADSEKSSVTVYEPTRYGALLRQAQALYLRGDYHDAKALWADVLSLDRNCQLAYRGLSMAYYNEGEYQAALESARMAADYAVYDLAWKEIVNGFVADHFVWLLLAVLAVAGAGVWLMLVVKKRNKVILSNPRVKLMLSVPFHPFDSFDGVKYKGLGSVKIAGILTALFYIGAVLNITSSGFLYSGTLLRNYNSLYTLAGTAGLILLWSVCNWLVCSIASGKGRLQEVFVSTSYTLWPLIVFTFLKVIFSSFLPLSSAGLITGIETALLLYTFFLLCVAMITIHEYDFFKFILTGIVTVFLMILVVFVILMCAILIMQFGSFITSVYEEVVYR